MPRSCGPPGSPPGLILEQLAAAGGYSASTLSRLGSRNRRIRDVEELRRLADLYDVPVHLFGLANATGDLDGFNLARTADGGGDSVHRRNFLVGTAVIGVSAALPTTPATAAPAGNTIEDVLFGRLTAEPLPAQQLAAARADYRAARYTRLARPPSAEPARSGGRQPNDRRRLRTAS